MLSSAGESLADEGMGRRVKRKRRTKRRRKRSSVTKTVNFRSTRCRHLARLSATDKARKI
jgi:hypothetical protein